MRQVSRKRDRAAPRQRPRPRWLLPVQLTAAAVALVTVVGVGYRLLDDLGILRRGFAVVEQRAVDLSGEAGLVVRRIEGRRHVCRLEPGALATVAAWLRFHERSWAASLDSLDELLQPIDD